MFWIYALSLMAVAFVIAVATWPVARPFLNQYSNSPESTSLVAESDSGQIEREPGLNFGGVRLYSDSGKNTLWTTIKLLDRKGKEQYVEGLSKDNFVVLEDYLGGSHNASIIDIGHTRHGRSVAAIFLIDNSGSMRELSGVGSYKKVEVAKRAAISFIEKLIQSENTYIAVLPFSGAKAKEKHFLKNSNTGIWWGYKQVRQLNKLVAGFKPDGGTPLWEAIDVALEQFRTMADDTYKVIVCLTDGMNTTGDTPYLRLLQKARDNQIPIFTLCYGMMEQIQDKELVELSRESGAGDQQIGSFIRIPPKDWSTKLQHIQSDISNLYELSWLSTGASLGTSVNVKIKVGYEHDNTPYQKELHRQYTVRGTDQHPIQAK